VQNNQLLVWYAWAHKAGDTVAGMPEGAKRAINNLLSQLEGLILVPQMSMFRSFASNMPQRCRRVSANVPTFVNQLGSLTPDWNSANIPN